MRFRVFTALLALGTTAIAPLAGPARGDTEGEFSYGGQWWTQSAREAKFMEFREVPLGGLLDSYWLRNDSGRNTLLLSGVHALKEDQATGLRWRDGARFRLDVGYAQLPHLFSWVARSPYTQSQPGVFTLPDSLQRANQNNPGAFVPIMTDALSNAPRIPLEFRTDVSRVGVRARADRHWTFDVRGTRRLRSGSKAYGVAFGFNSAIEVVQPLSQRMLDGDALVEYKRETLTVQGDFGASGFRNDVGRILLDNPKRITDRTTPTAYIAGDGSAQGQLDLPPDNRVYRGSVALGWVLPRRTMLHATVAVSRMTQDDKWLPFTVNTAIPQSSIDSLPGRSTDASALLYMQDYRLTSHPWSRVSGTLRFHQDHYDNNTPEHTFTGGVRIDQVWEPGATTTHPYSNSTAVGGVDVDFDATRQLSVGGTYEFRRRDHSLREVEQDDENVIAGRLRLHPSRSLHVRADYKHGDRKGDNFIATEYQDDAGNFTEQPGLRRYDVADRKHDEARADVGWSASDKVAVGVAFDWTHDDFGASALGLQNRERNLIGAYGNFMPNDRVTWSVGGGYEKATTAQESRESPNTLVFADTTSWTADLDDHNAYVFTAVEWWAKPEKMSLSASYTFSHARGAFDLGNFKNTAVDLPDTKYDTHDFLIEARYHLLHNFEVAGRYGFERFDVRDFASENVPLLNVASGASNAIFLGDSTLDYHAHRVALIATQRF